MLPAAPASRASLSHGDRTAKLELPAAGVTSHEPESRSAAGPGLGPGSGGPPVADGLGAGAAGPGLAPVLQPGPWQGLGGQGRATDSEAAAP